jgi:hypothetical protein
MNKKQTLIQKLRDVMAPMQAEIPLLLAAYVAGDPILGRPLWKSYLEVALIPDVDSSSKRSRFFRQEDLLPYGQYHQLRELLEDTAKRPLKLRMCRLTQAQDGTIGLDYERSQPTIFHRQIAMNTMRGARIFAADDFLLGQFEQDIRATWADYPEFQTGSEKRVQSLLDAYGLPAPSQYNAPGIDTLWVCETLNMLRNLINSTRDLRRIDFKTFSANPNLRSRTRYSWRTMSNFSSEVALHLVSNWTTSDPQNFTQLALVLVEMGIIHHADVDGMAALCARPLSGKFSRQMSEEDVEAYTLFLTHTLALDHFVEGAVHQIHGRMPQDAS